MGGQSAQQQSGAAHVRFGSLADIATPSSDVRCTPESGHRPVRLFCATADASHRRDLIHGRRRPMPARKGEG